MGEGRKPDLLEPQKVTTAATVQSCEWKRICYQGDERGTARIAKYSCGEENSIFLQQKKTADGKEKRRKQCCFQVRISFCRLLFCRSGGNQARQSRLDTCSISKCGDRENQLLQTDFFGRERSAEKNTVKKSHYTGENAGCSKDKGSFQEKMFL